MLGIDLADWLRRQRVVAILDVIDSLPPASHYHAALANDPEQAELMAQALAQAEPSEWRPPQHEVDLKAQLLMEIRDALRARP